MSEARDAEEHAGRLLAVAHLLGEMAVQALRQGEMDAARGLVDCVETLRVKTEGNTGPDEQRVLDEVLHQLRLAVLKGPPPAPPQPSAAPSDVPPGEAG
ncbi:MAG: DUF1844 domain-containing protein [Candidatus Eiseniibacteriota bacterium]